MVFLARRCAALAATWLLLGCACDGRSTMSPTASAPPSAPPAAGVPSGRATEADRAEDEASPASDAAATFEYRAGGDRLTFEAPARVRLERGAGGEPCTTELLSRDRAQNMYTADDVVAAFEDAAVQRSLKAQAAFVDAESTGELTTPHGGRLAWVSACPSTCATETPPITHFHHVLEVLMTNRRAVCRERSGAH